MRCSAMTAARPRQRAELARDHRRDVARRTPSATSERRHAAASPRRGEAVHIVRLVDLVAERDRLAGAQAQQVARGQRADDVAGLVGDAEMADLEPVHAADGAIDEGVGRDHRERLAREAARPASRAHRAPCSASARNTSRSVTMPVSAARQPARVGPSDARTATRSARPSFARAPRQRTFGGDECARRAHDVADAVAIGIAVDAAERALGIEAARGLDRLEPAGAMLLRRARRSAPGRRASASASVRMPPSRSFGTSAEKICAVVTASPSAEWRSVDLDAEPGASSSSE